MTLHKHFQYKYLYLMIFWNIGKSIKNKNWNKRMISEQSSVSRNYMSLAGPFRERCRRHCTRDCYKRYIAAATHELVAPNFPTKKKTGYNRTNKTHAIQPKCVDTRLLARPNTYFHATLCMQRCHIINSCKLVTSYFCIKFCIYNMCVWWLQHSYIVHSYIFIRNDIVLNAIHFFSFYTRCIFIYL